MKLDARLRNGMTHAIDDAKAAEEAGFDGAWSTENQHDPFLPLALAAEHTERLDLGPSVAIAFARTPMTVAVQANDLHRFSGGRMHLGLGSQIRPHITKRFSMEWSKPADRMREFVQALHAIWNTWNEGTPLKFDGDFYTHTLMIPAFTPPPNPHGPPKVVLAAVGPMMTEVCGEVADGIQAHPFTTERYLREVTLPRLEAGRAIAGKTMEGFDVGMSVFVAMNDEEIAGVRKQISFYGSTPAYRPVLDLHGWGELQTEWNAMSKQGSWDAMAQMVPDEVFDAMAVVGTPKEIATELHRRYDGLVGRMRFNVPGDTPSPSRFAELVDAMRA